MGDEQSKGTATDQAPAVLTQAQWRACIEQRLAPLACSFSHAGDGTLTLRVFEPDSGRVDLVVSGLRIKSLQSEADVLRLIDELLYELDSNSLGQP
ncbi:MULTISPECIES: DUF1652 domain-containing protein [Pseudomonas]|uniref:DUF1652 domain-containing protein n=1 Tax=Pseudomonas TaxID=286 RepID=UPI0003067FE5|nr:MULTISPECIES: DUF1652 domain-containing protein [Pseudomonas]MDF2399190.1 DUF1652 domain-containing protein [Pseudomonas sp. 3MA1]MDP9530277.1 DUF1652 domain-containing protein [Pseudomonas protegens]RBJ86139.1 DUF1652 domain-containing protein [Pseudomonas sp. MWU12-2534b]